MKVVLFCGGLGLRIRDTAQSPDDVAQRRTTDVPKPLQLVGGRPLLWHVMSWYARHGHTEFVLCLGAGGDHIRQWVSSAADAIELHPGDHDEVVSVSLHGGEMDGWRIDLAETGRSSSIGERLRRVRPLVADEPMFLANYADGLSDVPLQQLVDTASASGAVATFLAVPPQTSLHSVRFDPRTGYVSDIGPLAETGVFINGGFFVFRQQVFDSIRPDEELVDEPFARLADARQLLAVPYHGFWRACDTAKDRKILQDLWDSGQHPWSPAVVGVLPDVS